MYLPLTNNPEETFNIPIFNIVYNFRQLWNGNTFWSLDISDSDNISLASGIKIVAGENITGQYPQIPFNLINSTTVDPGRLDLESFQLEVTEK